SAVSATARSPLASPKILVEASSASRVYKPVAIDVSDRQRSSLTFVLVARTANGEPDAGGSIQIELPAGSAAGANRSSTTISAWACALYFAGRSNAASNRGLPPMRALSGSGSSEYIRTRNRLSAG